MNKCRNKRYKNVIQIETQMYVVHPIWAMSIGKLASLSLFHRAK